jgi:membrane associated rhomboid family serine protease
MNSAPVGYQCPECVRAGAATVPQARTVFGGRITRDGAVTMTLIGICVGAYLLIGALDLFGGNARWGMSPVDIALGDQWFRMLSSVFMHQGLLHLGFNMYVLFLLGRPLERVLGHGRFLTLFLVSGIGGAVASYAFSPVLTLSVGASGAIYGLMAGYIVIARRLDAEATQIIILLAINVVLGFVMSGIDWRAHLGGAATGAVTALVLSTGRGRRGHEKLPQQAVATALILVALAAVALWRTDQIQQAIPL